MVMIGSGSGSGRGTELLLTDCALRTLPAHCLHTNAFVGINNASTPFGPMIAHVRSRFSGVMFESSYMLFLPTCRYTVGDHAQTY